MSIGFIPPVVEVLEDQRITTAELNWLTQGLLMVVTAAVLMTAFWKMIEEGIE